MRYLVITLCLLLSACVSLTQRQQMDLLDSTSRSYGKAVRWGYFDSAVQFIKIKDGKSISVKPGAYKDIKVIGYEQASSIAADDLSYAEIIVEIKYYRESSAVVKTLVDKQRWEYDTSSEKWYLNGKLPAF